MDIEVRLKLIKEHQRSIKELIDSEDIYGIEEKNKDFKRICKVNEDINNTFLRIREHLFLASHSRTYSRR